MIIPWLYTHGRGRPLTLANIERSLARFAGRVPANAVLTEHLRRAETGIVFSAPYLVARHAFYFSPDGQIPLPGLKPQEVQLAGWFKIFPHPRKPGVTLFVIDTAPEALDSLRIRRPPGPAALSLNEHFMSLYVCLAKSGAGNFSIRTVPSGERAAAVDQRNWTKTSQLLFPVEQQESSFISYLRESTRQPWK